MMWNLWDLTVFYKTLTLTLNCRLGEFSELVWTILEKTKISCPYWDPNPWPSSSYCCHCTDCTMKTTVYWKKTCLPCSTKKKVQLFRLPWHFVILSPDIIIKSHTFTLSPHALLIFSECHVDPTWKFWWLPVM